MKNKKIVVLHQGYNGSNDPMIANAVRVKNNLSRSIEEIGYNPSPVYLDREFEWVQKIIHLRPLLVFNAADLGFFCNNAFEPNIAAVLDGIGIPYTGSDYYCNAFSGDKFASKLYIKRFGVPTPKILLAEDAVGKKLDFPLILKHRRNHNSFCLSSNSVIFDYSSLDKKLSEFDCKSNDEWVLEEYINGPEICVGFIGNSDRIILPLARFEFEKEGYKGPKIRDYTGKWKGGSKKDLQIQVEPANMPEGIEKQLAKYANTIADCFNICDYGRFDFRIKSNGDNGGKRIIPCLIDINSNPDVNDDATLYKMVEGRGFSYTQFIEKIIEAAMERTKNERFTNARRGAYYLEAVPTR